MNQRCFTGSEVYKSSSRRVRQEVIEKIYSKAAFQKFFGRIPDFSNFPASTGFLVMTIKKSSDLNAQKRGRECLIKFIQTRVPIENGSGLFNQVSDFIKLPAACWDGVELFKKT